MKLLIFLVSLAVKETPLKFCLAAISSNICDRELFQVLKSPANIIAP